MFTYIELLKGSGPFNLFFRTHIDVKNATIAPTHISAPTQFALYQNYPNPFNPATTINYSIPQLSEVTIMVFDILGKEIETLVNEVKSPGTYELTWHADYLPSGVYFYRLKVYPASGGAGDLPAGKAGFTETKKMLLVK